MTQPAVSVLVPCFNSGWCLDALAACLRTLVNLDVEVVFVDDGSTDGSFDLFHKLVPTAVCVRQENRGVGHSRNRAAELARGEYLQLLDADDTIEPDKLTAQLTHAQAGRLDVVYSDWDMVEVAPDGGRTVIPHQATPPVPDMVEALLSGWWFSNNAALIRREAYLAVGGCDPSLGNATCEDFALWARLAVAGRSFGYLPGRYASYFRYRRVASMSRKDPTSFFRGEQRIIIDTLAQLEAHGHLTPARRRAAARRLHAVARNVYHLDRQWFARLLDRVRELDPAFRPPGSWAYQAAARLVGLAGAEWLVARWRPSGPVRVG